ICLVDARLPSEEQRSGVLIKRRLTHAVKSPFRRGYQHGVQQSVNAVLAEQYDGLHCHDYHMLTIGALAKQVRPTPLVYDAHEYLAGWPFYSDSRTFSSRLKGRLVWEFEVWKEARNIRSTDRIVTISAGIAEAMRRRFHLQDLPLVVRN